MLKLVRRQLSDTPYWLAAAVRFTPPRGNHPQLTVQRRIGLAEPVVFSVLSALINLQPAVAMLAEPLPGGGHSPAGFVEEHRLGFAASGRSGTADAEHKFDPRTMRRTMRRTM